MSATLKPTVVKTVEEFANMSAEEICQVMQFRKSYWIVGDQKGIDMHIVDKNPPIISAEAKGGRNER